MVPGKIRTHGLVSTVGPVLLGSTYPMPTDVNALNLQAAPFSFPTAPPAAVELLCRWLRGEACAWPTGVDTGYAQAFVERCVHEGVGGLLHVLCNRAPEWASWPAEVREALSRRASMLTAVEMLRTVALGRVVEALTRHGIGSLLLKGASLAYTHYPSPGLRERADDDLFIDLRDIRAICRVLSELGYEISGTLYSSHQFTAVQEGKAGVASQIDVHWRISNSPRYARFLSFAEAATRSVRIPKVREHARGLGAVDALMLACVHRAANPDHDQNRLIWLYDIHLLAEALDAGQQAEFADLARRRGTASVCLEGIALAQRRLGTAFSDETKERLALAAAEEVADPRFSESYLALVLDDLRHLAGIRPRLGLVRELLFPPAGTMKERYGVSNPALLAGLYVWRGTRGGLKRLAGR
jgi:hypothetical protein